jgi:hypothetical protein
MAVTQGIGPEFKPQYSTHTQKNVGNNNTYNKGVKN